MLEEATSRVRRLGSRFFGRLSREEFDAERERLLAHVPVPVFWMFGKTGSGKTSIIRYLTGAERAQIGNGFRPETTRSYRYDFPTSDSPILQFLDTRGLGETRYDPTEDIESFDTSSHLIIVTVKAMDHALESVIGPLRSIRRAKPTRPILLAVTHLHEAYPQEQHPVPDPFMNGEEGIPNELRRSLGHQREAFAGLVDAVVPIDLTLPEEGYEEPNFGGDRLKASIIELLPAAYRQTFIAVETVMSPLRNLYERRAMPHVLAASSLAATAAAFPLPWLDIPVVAAVQTNLIYRLAEVYGQSWNVQALLKMTSAIGGRLLLRQIVREAFKVIPGVGVAINAALAFGYTYGLGKACCWYFAEMREGHAPTAAELEKVIHEQMNVAQTIWQKSRAPEAQL